MIYHSVDYLEQDSDEWRDWRRKVIGASDAPIIMGENRWKGRDSLIEEKLGEKEGFRGNSITREGKELEEPARYALNKLLSANLQPRVIQSTWSPHHAASLDGVDEKKGLIVEIKCGKRTYDHVRDHRTIPGHYVAQLQHILMVARCTHLFFAVFRPGRELITLKVDYSKPYIDALYAREREFANTLLKRGHKLQGSYIGRLFDITKRQ